MADKKLGIPRKLKTETHKQLKIRTDMNSDAPYESAVRTYIFNCAAIKKSHYGSKAYPCPNIPIPLAKWTTYASILK
jgi:hypothetical protein